MSTELADEATFHSAILSGHDPSKGFDEKYILHRDLMRAVFGCTTGVLTHPIVINMTLCNDRMHKELRTGIKAGDAGFVPNAQYVPALLKSWWWALELSIAPHRTLSVENRRDFCWSQHDHFICMEPFGRANGRTGRVIYYMLNIALDVPIHVISSEKGSTYYRHRKEYRDNVFVPRMCAHGYITL